MAGTPPPPPWRADLARLEPLRLPLLPCGAGTEKKAPINPRTGGLMTAWEKAAFVVSEIAALNGSLRSVGTRCGPDAHGLTSIDIDGPAAVEYCQARGCDPLTAPTWRVHRSNHPGRLKVLWRIPPELWHFLEGFTRRKFTIPGAPPDTDGKGQQVEAFWSAGQVVIAGEHPASGGYYHWPQGAGPEALADIPPEWWGLLLELVHGPQPAQHTGIRLDIPSPPPAATGPADPIPLEQLLSRDQEATWRSGVAEGGRNDAAFRLAVGLITAADGAAAAGLRTTGTPEALLLDFAARCSPPLPETETLTCLRSAQQSPRTPDPGLAERLRFWLRKETPPSGPQEPPQGGSPPPGDGGGAGGAQGAPRRSLLLAAALDAAEAGDEDTYAEIAAELQVRFRLSPAAIQSALFRLLITRRSTGRTPQPGHADVAVSDLLEHLLPGFVPANEQALLFAPRGAGKTIAALAIARSICLGQPLLDQGTPPAPGRVLYLATDSGLASLHTQMQELGLLDLPEFRFGTPEQRFFVRGYDVEQGVSAWEATIPEILWLLRFVQEHQIDLVIIDSAKTTLCLTEIDYTSNQAVSALLTLFQRVVCPRVSVLWLHHDGAQNGNNAGAKAWAEIPVMVHRIERLEPPKPGAPDSGENDRGRPPRNARRWCCVKSRISHDEREFVYGLSSDGDLVVADTVEIVSNCQDAILDVLQAGGAMGGRQSLHRDALFAEVIRNHGYSAKSVENTLARMCRGRSPLLVRPRRGWYQVSPSEAARARALRGWGEDGGGKIEIHSSATDLSFPQLPPIGGNRGKEFPPTQNQGEAEIHCAGTIPPNPPPQEHPPCVRARGGALPPGTSVEVLISNSWRSGWVVAAHDPDAGLVTVTRADGTPGRLHKDPAAVRPTTGAAP